MKKNMNFLRSLLVMLSLGLVFAPVAQTVTAQVPTTVNQAIGQNQPFDISSFFGGQDDLAAQQKAAQQKAAQELAAQQKAAQEQLEKIANPARLPEYVRAEVLQAIAACDQLGKNIDTNTYYKKLSSDIYDNCSLVSEKAPYLADLKKELATFYKDLKSGALLDFALGNLEAPKAANPLAMFMGGEEEKEIHTDPKKLTELLTACKEEIASKTEDSFKALSNEINELLAFIPLISKTGNEETICRQAVERVTPQYNLLSDSYVAVQAKIAHAKTKLADSGKQEDKDAIETLSFYEGELKATFNAIQTFFDMYKQRWSIIKPILYGIGIAYQLGDIFMQTTDIKKTSISLNTVDSQGDIIRQIFDLIGKFFGGIKTNWYAWANKFEKSGIIGTCVKYGLAIPGFIYTSAAKKEYVYSVAFRSAFTGTYFFQQRENAKNAGVAASVKGQMPLTAFTNPLNTVEFYAKAVQQSFFMLFTCPDKYALNLSQFRLLFVKRLVLGAVSAVDSYFALPQWVIEHRPVLDHDGNQVMKQDATQVKTPVTEKVPFAQRFNSKYITTQFVECFGTMLFYSAAKTTRKQFSSSTLAFLDKWTLGVVNFSAGTNFLANLFNKGLTIGLFGSDKFLGIPFRSFAKIDADFVFRGDKYTDIDAANGVANHPVTHHYSWAQEKGYANQFRFFALTQIVDYPVKRVCKRLGRMAGPAIFKGAGAFINGLSSVASSVKSLVSKMWTKQAVTQTQPVVTMATLAKDDYVQELLATLKDPAQFVDKPVKMIVGLLVDPMMQTAIIPVLKSMRIIPVEETNQTKITYHVLDYILNGFFVDYFEYMSASDVNFIISHYLEEQEAYDKDIKTRGFSKHNPKEVLKTDLLTAIKSGFASWVSGMIAEHVIAPYITEMAINSLVDVSSVKAFIGATK